MVAKDCAHDGITPDHILRFRLVVGLRDDKFPERLLRINALSLHKKTIDICRAVEQTSQQLKLMNNGSEDTVRYVRLRTPEQPRKRPHSQVRNLQRNPRKTRVPAHNWPECKNCGRHHANRQNPAYEQTCRNCSQKNVHSQLKCRAATARVSSVQMPEEVFHTSQVGSGSRAMIAVEVGKPTTQSLVTFQLDTGAKCNLSLKDYRRATGNDELVQAVQRCSNEFIKTYTNERYKILGSTEIC